VDGFDHTGWLTIIRHYATQFKDQTLPQGDAIIAWARPHTANAQADDPVGQPKNFELVEDKSWFAVFASEPSTVILAGSKEDANPTKQEIPAGLSLVERPLAVGDGIYARLERDGFEGLELDTAGQFRFSDRAEKGYNFNVAVFSVGDVVKA
jgi:glucan endo-1,3-alpha-glucosidase